MPRIALNGLGRIGKLVLRDLIDTGAGGDIVLLNDPVGDAEQHALLMEFDSVHGRWRTPVAAAEGALELNGKRIRLTHEKTIEALLLAELGVACCRFRGHEDKIVTKETEIGHGETEVHEGVQV